MDILSELFAAFSMQFVNALCDNSGADFGQRMQVIQNASNEMICQMIGAALSALDDTLAKQASAEGEWMVLRKAERELETSFGCVRFWRRYYRNRHSGKTCHLLDVHLGITAGQRVSNDVRHRAVATLCCKRKIGLPQWDQQSQCGKLSIGYADSVRTEI